MDLFVTLDDLILVPTPGVREVSDSIVQVGCIKVNDSREDFILVQQVPGGEVAVQDNCLRSFQVQAVKTLSRLVDVPPHDVSFGRPEFLVFPNQAREIRVPNHFIRPTEPSALSHNDKGSLGLVQFRKEASALSTFPWLIGCPRCTRKELRQAPSPPLDFNWLLYGRWYRPSIFLQTGQNLEFIGHVWERRSRVAAGHQAAAPGLDKPALFVSTTQIVDWLDPPSPRDGARNLRWRTVTIDRGPTVIALSMARHGGMRSSSTPSASRLRCRVRRRPCTSCAAG